ncbi:MAG TPA: hypothetical protein VMV90_02910 [Rectinemataceae bacterium]|nr:hypothetical protein [Rectinemataceae bacterium]
MCDDSRLGRPSRPEPVYAVGPMNGVYPLVYQNVVTSFDNTFSVAGGANFSLFDLQAAANYRQAQEGQRATATAYEYRRRLILNAARKLHYRPSCSARWSTSKSPPSGTPAKATRTSS